jgi:branched-chain amino acid transport system ATP-binding protein
MTTLLDVDRLTVHYGRTPAVHEVSLHVDENEAVALIGPNGAGKTTILNALAGIVRPSGGRIEFKGAGTAGEPPEKLVRRGLALVPEHRQIFTSLTVEENLRLATFVGRGRDADADIEAELDRFPPLRPYIRSHAGGLSGGEQQMLAISRALLCRPDLLLLDEPSLGLGPRVVETVFEALRELRVAGVTILLVEQNAFQAIEFADRTYVLSGGRIVVSGTSGELQADPRIESAYLGAGLEPS